MNAERWTRVSEILQGALDRPADERQDYVLRHAAGDPELAREVESLLTIERRSGDTLEPVRPAQEADTERWVGERVGPYRIESCLGAGGMGSVFRARREDGEFDQTVALKLVRLGMDTERILERFRHERQVLASLEHPGIARLVDGGTTDDGRPYLAMEHVDGEPIDRHCKSNGLGVQAVLALFLEVCEAVQFAHRSLVVHRDLKPANILVTPEGKPKLLDFGLAKVLTPEGRERTQDLTAEGERMLTPHYASPEQLRGAPVTTATDVYALGVLLYEFLAGRRPYDLHGLPWAEVERRVCIEPPSRPSAAALAEKNTALARQLDGDLDAIVLTALRKEPERRYGSVESFAEDVRRRLKGLPVRARPDTVSYRVARFLRRNRLPVAAAAVTALALVSGLIGTTHQYVRAEDRAEELELLGGDLQRQTARAEARAQELEVVSEDLRRQTRLAEERFEDVHDFATSLVFELHDLIVGLPGSTAAREVTVQRGVEYLNKLAEQPGNDPDFRSELVSAFVRMGDILGNPTTYNLGRAAEALELYRRAYDLSTELAAESPGDRSFRLLTVRSGGLVGCTLRTLGRTEEAIDWLEAAIEAGHELCSVQEAGRRELVSTSMFIDQLVAEHTDAGRFEEAQLLLEDEFALMERFLELTPERLDAINEFSAVFWRQARLQAASGDLQAGIESMWEASRMLEAAMLPRGGNVRTHHLLTAYRSELGDMLVRAEEPEAALVQLEPALRAAEAILRRDPGNALARADLSQLLTRTGRACAASGDRKRAEPLLRRGVEEAESVAANGPGDARWLLLVTKNRRHLAEFLTADGVDDYDLKELDIALHEVATHAAQAGDAPGVCGELVLTLLAVAEARLVALTHATRADGGRTLREAARADLAEARRLVETSGGRGPELSKRLAQLEARLEAR